MNELSIGASSLGNAMDQQTFGAQVVTKTLDYMNNSGSSPAPVDKASAEGALVSKTLDYMNSGSGSDKTGMAQSYQFQKDVLGSYAGMGVINNLTI
ncbi:hypothetical protein [Pseudodesulfovibrio senegalensis]|uniref:Uncharacterized protein n=1 Tax=Pseudodesulfovibrio senegalensis TaxID=1721087 RepID=A0A6N6N264_9BACT|nr:hypothetical protein [Pseudodesulfovibrio senegalensis]KAB1440281.1 hypothetical protein F8A88_13600 [Pseudodesulfovibrio senegalensis]